MKLVSVQLPWLLVPFLLASSSSLLADVYRWVDENGEVHFSDKKPASVQAEVVDIETRKPPSEPDEGELRRLELVRQAEERFRETVKLSPPEAPVQVDHDMACRNARRNFAALQEVMPVYRDDAGNYRPQWHGDYYQGQRAYVKDDERETVKRKVMADIRAHCADPADEDALYGAYDEWIASEHCEIARRAVERAARPESRTPEDVLLRLRREHADACR